MNEHKKCEEQGFSSSVELIKYVDEGIDEIVGLYKDVCNDCGKEIGREKRVFKYEGD